MKMRKTLKKLAAGLAAAVMALGLVITNGAATVKAADPTLTLYVKIPDGSTASEYGVNVWGGATAYNTSGDTVTCWGNQEKPTCMDAGNGFMYIYLDSTTIEGIQFVKGSDTINNNIWNATIATLGLSAAYYDPSTSKWYKEATLTNEVAEPTLDDVFYLAGTVPGASWTIADMPEIKAGDNDNEWVLTIEEVAADTYAYKVLQDPADFGWTYEYGEGDLVDGNYQIVVNEDRSTVTITVTKSGDDISVAVTVTPPADEDDDTSGGDSEDNNDNNDNNDDNDDTTENSGDVLGGDAPVVYVILAGVLACAAVVINRKTRREF